MYQSELSLDASLRGAYALLNSSLPSLSRAVRHDVQLRPIPQAAADLLTMSPKRQVLPLKGPRPPPISMPHPAQELRFREMCEVSVLGPDRLFDDRLHPFQVIEAFWFFRNCRHCISGL